jgi:hypothetical protein
VTASRALAPAPDPAWWTLYPALHDAAAALGRPVAHLTGREPVSIGHPTDTTAPVTLVFVRYQDEDGAACGVVTLARPERVVTSSGDTEALAISVGTVVRHAGHAPGEFDPYDDGPDFPRGPLHLAGAAYPAAVCAEAPGVFVRAAHLPDGSAVAIWGPEHMLDREITLTA